MESSPLVKAHDHARAAAVATRRSSDTVVAINEHTQAAGEFAHAASSTSSVEALRTLKLLEEHHRRLAEILKLSSEPTSQSSDADQNEKSSDKEHSPYHDAHTKKESTGETSASKKLGLPTQRRYASREMSSSIASNLATARGIRSKYRGQPLAPSVSNDQAPGNVDALSRPQGPKAKMQNIIDHQPGKPTWVPPVSAQQRPDSHGKNTASPRPDAAPSVADDGGYTRFYNTFGSLINKISAPLAFAGLPLIQEESTVSDQPETPETSPTKRSHLKASPSRILEPDLSKIYSRATMQALAREGHGTNDSFYVVPTTGHTMSYANILSFAEKEKRRLESSSHTELLNAPEEDDDDFVDAREAPVPLSPGAKRRIGRANTDRDLNNTIEELYTENKSLKDMLDKLTKRLHAFEASAQNSAMALAESYRLMRPGSPTVVSKTSDAAIRKKNQEMEEQLAAAVKQMERLEKDNRKMQKTLEKYREKWEVLKAGAKARREAQGTGDSVEDAASASGQG
ncbi:hypothetical protein B0J13DRAFT_329755 [Dactylonectria estremocensis]|uniref:Uncharacterized protein n=1 Tax=Dactylonectria estremocensis TaxID=1079267 RepID=A0A9P9J3N6_9HYPO|nr:hypothetical protein B0J13DRAFT_329755 [Dactylonectria estremocensis]